MKRRGLKGSSFFACRVCRTGSGRGFFGIHTAIDENYYALNGAYPTDDQMDCLEPSYLTAWSVQSHYNQTTNPLTFLSSSTMGFSVSQLQALQSTVHQCYSRPAGVFGITECWYPEPNGGYGYQGGTGDSIINYCAIKPDPSATTELYSSGYSPCVAGDEQNCTHYLLILPLETTQNCPIGKYGKQFGYGLCIVGQ